MDNHDYPTYIHFVLLTNRAQQLEFPDGHPSRILQRTQGSISHVSALLHGKDKLIGNYTSNRCAIPVLPAFSVALDHFYGSFSSSPFPLQG